MFDQTYATRPPATPVALHAKPWRRRHVPALALGLMAVLGLDGGSAHAASTSFGPGSEATQTEILSNLYGGTFTRSGDSFSNGQVDVRQLDDEDGGARQIFQNDVVSARAVATFARNNQTFGTTTSGGGFSPLFTVSGSGFDVTGAADFRAGDESPLFGLRSGGSIFASNATGGRQAKQYAVSGGNGSGQSVLVFWEDTASTSSDFDYNDLVVEVATGAGGGGPANVLIPLPLSAWSALSVLGGMGLLAGVQRLRRSV